MGECVICHRRSDDLSGSVGVCAGCILADTPAARAEAVAAHGRARRRFGLPGRAPRAADGQCCDRCANACRIAQGDVGYCGVRSNDGGTIRGGDAESAAVQWYQDPLPTNCVADWVRPASGPAGYPAFTDTEGPEHGYHNLAVFYEACSFDCLFCQNWHFREGSLKGPRCSASASETSTCSLETHAAPPRRNALNRYAGQRPVGRTPLRSAPPGGVHSRQSPGAFSRARVSDAPSSPVCAFHRASLEGRSR